MRSVNALATDTRREMSTLVYVVLDPLTGRLCGSNAGHPPAMLRRAGGAVERWAAALAMPLGVTPEAGYGQSARTLGAGEALLLFTDGLIERRGLALEDALDRLAGLIPPAGGADDVRTAVLDGMLGEEDHDDDVAVLVVARPPAA
jgi:serine phosphatase RsbU (regulator of sigma subunit)